MTGYDGFTTPCSSDASNSENGNATTSPYCTLTRLVAKTASESTEAIVRIHGLLFAGFVARMEEERLPQRVMFGKLVGGKGNSGEREKDWLVHLKEDISAFEMKFEGLRKAAQKTGKWFGSLRKEPTYSCGNGMRWRDAELQDDTRRLRRALRCRHP